MRFVNLICRRAAVRLTGLNLTVTPSDTEPQNKWIRWLQSGGSLPFIVYMSAAKSQAIEFCVLPRDAKIPSDMLALDSAAILSFCPVKSVSRRSRVDHIACLIDETLVEAGR